MTIPEVIDELYRQAHKAAKIPRRDKREPGRMEKERADVEIYALFRRVFARQQRAAVAWLEKEYPERKAMDLPPDWFEWDEDEIEELIRKLKLAYKNGIKLFGATLPAELDFDFTLTNTRAAAIAQAYAYDLISKRTGGIAATTRDTLQRTISAFVETPGMTLGDVTRNLVSSFGEQRAQMIAITEVTRAYSEAAQAAAADLKEKYPDVRVTKTWFTAQVEALVCEEYCAPLEGVEINEDETFEPGTNVFGEPLLGPPAHPNCNCWLGHRTRIGG